MSEINTINKSKKKDDLADCFLQALAYTNHCSLNCISLLKNESIYEKIISRKPTEKQIKNGYSLSNLKYLYTNMSLSDFKKDEKVIRAIKTKMKCSIEEVINRLEH